MSVRIHLDTTAFKAYMGRLQKALSPAGLTEVFFRVALSSFSRLVSATPKKRGITKREWKVKRSGTEVSVDNATQVMQYLEYGTKAHGPVRANRLFIPLTMSATVTGWRKGMVFGRDYVLAKRVRGIKAMNLTQKEQPVAEAQASLLFEQYIERVQ